MKNCLGIFTKPIPKNKSRNAGKSLTDSIGSTGGRIRQDDPFAGEVGADAIRLGVIFRPLCLGARGDGGEDLLL